MWALDAQNVKMTGSSDPLDAQLQRFSTMLTVRNLSASEEFYVRYLGFRVSERQEGLRLLERPGIALYLISESPPTPDKPSITLVPPLEHNRPSVNLVFRVSDARATHAALVKLGLRFLASPQQPPWGGWRCFAQDPDGYLIEIEQP
jgi:catechol 2,3-dioxygenase-like lactoylglutathione lyase family enzyme